MTSLPRSHRSSQLPRRFKTVAQDMALGTLRRIVDAVADASRRNAALERAQYDNSALAPGARRTLTFPRPGDQP